MVPSPGSRELYHRLVFIGNTPIQTAKYDSGRTGRKIPMTKRGLGYWNMILYVVKGWTLHEVSPATLHTERLERPSYTYTVCFPTRRIKH